MIMNMILPGGGSSIKGLSLSLVTSQSRTLTITFGNTGAGTRYLVLPGQGYAYLSSRRAYVGGFESMVVSNLTNCTYEEIDYGAYLVTTTGGNATLTFQHPASSSSAFALDAVYGEI